MELYQLIGMQPKCYDRVWRQHVAAAQTQREREVIGMSEKVKKAEACGAPAEVLKAIKREEAKPRW